VREPVAVVIVSVVRHRHAVARHVRQPATVRIVGVVINACHAADGFGLGGDAAGIVSREGREEREAAIGDGRVSLRLAKARVCPCVIHVAQGCARQPPVLQVANQGQIPGLRQQPVVIIPKGNRVAAIDRQRVHPEEMSAMVGVSSSNRR
jgi:hypothetical protein